MGNTRLFSLMRRYRSWMDRDEGRLDLGAGASSRARPPIRRARSGTDLTCEAGWCMLYEVAWMKRRAREEAGPVWILFIGTSRDDVSLY
uniref:Uncharacterized protein n=1 Tax=Oryza punctata TaxID=4537 RepID=A0A0E0KAU8_ORYPU